MDIRSLIIMLLSIVAGGFLRFVISEPKVLFALGDGGATADCRVFELLCRICF